MLRNTSTVVPFAVHAKTERMWRITHHQEPSTVSCSIVVSCRTTMFGPSMEKEELYWIIMKKKRTGFLTLQPNTVLFWWHYNGWAWRRYLRTRCRRWSGSDAAWSYGSLRNRKGIERSEAYVGGLQNIIVPRLQTRPQKVGYHTGIVAMEGIK